MQSMNRLSWKLAERIQAQLGDFHLQRYCAFEQQLGYLTATLSQLEMTRRKLAKATPRRYVGAANRLRSRTVNLIADLQHQVETTRRMSSEPILGAPRLSDIVSELDQVAGDFGDWRFDANDDSICVTTDPIELEGLYLGPFEIRLIICAMTELRSRPPFTAVALDPHPACGADHVTHPHVSDNRVCLGDAVSAAASALESGRIGDFFLIVRSVLTHYNPDSPYVSIENWEGEQCADCGAGVCEDDRYYCEMCEETYCDNCMSLCRGCELSTCLSCLRQCSFCDEWNCRECMMTCSACGDPCCKACLCNDLCPDCHERNETNGLPEETQEKRQVPATIIPTQPEAA